MTGCSIGEVLGMVIGTTLGLAVGSTIAFSFLLAFLFGYLLTMLPLLCDRVTFRRALELAFASDTVSIAIMEIVDNGILLEIPGAMDAGIGEFKFWGSFALSLLIAGAAAFPVVRWLILRGHGHAVVHTIHAKTARMMVITTGRVGRINNRIIPPGGPIPVIRELGDCVQSAN